MNLEFVNSSTLCSGRVSLAYTDEPLNFAVVTSFAGTFSSIIQWCEAIDLLVREYRANQ